MKYIGLLRGINVSGKNKIPMNALKQELENLGIENVITYLNSGNIIFNSDNQEPDNLIHEMIRTKFNLDIPVCIIKYQKLKYYQKTNWWSKTASTNIKDYITIRTANTINKLLDLGK